MPSDTDIVFERFFDDAGGMQLVVHAPFGGRVNRGFGLALRKRFCVNFDFELQAAATDDAVVLSIGPQHSFPLEDAFSFVRADNVRESLEQAILVRADVRRALALERDARAAVLRSNGGKQVPPPIQRMRSDDLLAAVFPRAGRLPGEHHRAARDPRPPADRARPCATACTRRWTSTACTACSRRIERGEIRLHARDTTEPSPFAHEILNAQAVRLSSTTRRWRSAARAPSRCAARCPRTSAISARSTPPRSSACATKRAPSRATPTSCTICCSASCSVPPRTERSVAARGSTELVRGAAARRDGRAIGGRAFWFATEHLRAIEALYPDAAIAPPVRLPPHLDGPRGRARGRRARRRARPHGVPRAGDAPPRSPRCSRSRAGEVTSALARLEGEGIVLRGRFTPGIPTRRGEWCDRRLLARIHRYTLDRLRSEIEPVSAQDFMRYLFARQHVGGSAPARRQARAARSDRAAAGLRDRGGRVGARRAAVARR